MTEHPRILRPLPTGRVVDDIRVTTVVVSGEVDLANAHRLTDALDNALDTRPDAIVVDLTEVTLFGSAGCRALLHALERTHLRGSLFALTHNPLVSRALFLANSRALLDVMETPRA